MDEGCRRWDRHSRLCDNWRRWTMTTILARWKEKGEFDIVTEKDTFFGEKNAIGRNPGKLPIIEMPYAFDPSVEAGPS